MSAETYVNDDSPGQIHFETGKKMRAGEGENRAREKGHETEGRTPSLLALIPSLRSCVPHRQLCIHTNAKKTPRG